MAECYQVRDAEGEITELYATSLKWALQEYAQTLWDDADSYTQGSMLHRGFFVDARRKGDYWRKYTISTDLDPSFSIQPAERENEKKGQI